MPHFSKCPVSQIRTNRGARSNLSRMDQGLIITKNNRAQLGLRTKIAALFPRTSEALMALPRQTTKAASFLTMQC